MAESSLFAQRLQALTERRRLQERILATRRELEEERLRAQRLKRKSLRDRWLMEGTSTPTDDNVHTSSSWEADTRIQELECDLSSFESQMQQLDNPEFHQGRRQLEEPVKAVKEVKPSLDSIGKVDGTCSSSPEGRSSAKSRPELAPVPPKRPMSAAAKEKLQNGDMPGVGPFGSQCSPDKVDIKMSPVVTEAGDVPSHQKSSEPAPAPKHNLNPSEAPASRQRKLAVEEMVIRDHLGQEVGSMDAVGQKQGSIGKEEEVEDHTDLGDVPEKQSSPAPCILGHEKALEASETQVGSELGCRDGPEGQSPTSQDQQSPSEPLQAENSYLSSLKQQAHVELGSLAKGATEIEVEQKELPEQSAKAAEPAEDLAVGNSPAAEPVRLEQEKQVGKQGLQESPGSETTVDKPGAERWESCLDQPTPLLAKVPPVQETEVPSSIDKAKIPLLDPVLSSSLLDQSPLTLQDQVPSLQDAKGSLLDQLPSSFQETEGSRLDPILSLLPTQNPSTRLDQAPPLQEIKDSPLCQIPCSLEEPLLDSNPPSHLHHISSSPEQKLPSLQGEIIFSQETKHSFLDQIPSSLNEANGQLLHQIPTSVQDQNPSLPNQILSPLPDQFAPPLKVDSALPGQILSSLSETDKSLQISTAFQGQDLSVQEAKEPLPDVTSTSLNQPSSLPDKITSLQEAKRSSLDEIPLTLQDQMPTPSEAQVFSQPEANISLPGQIPFSVDGTKHIFPGETPASVPDQIPSALQDQKPTFLEEKTTSSLQEVGGSLPNQIQASLPSPTSPEAHLPEATGSSPDQAQPTLREEMLVSLSEQTPFLQEAEKSLPEGQIPISLPEEKPTQLDQAPNKLQSSTLQGTAAFPDVLPLSTQEPVQSTLEKTASEENEALKEGGNASLVTAATAEVTEVLENLHAEQQPLLEECKASVVPPDTSIGDLQSKATIIKPLVATSQEAPTYTTISANTASSCQLQPSVPCQGEDEEQGQSRRKQKSCQCCSVM
ncbi:hypothetical protein lerEdw1_002143 [Lerista edwardsae]|nr:hypothetical protein lerEdw1_002143 [Lerista edwardsae]